MKSIEVVSITSSDNNDLTLDTTVAGKVADNFKAVTDLYVTTKTGASGDINVTVDGTKNVTATANITGQTVTVTGGKNIVAKTDGAIKIAEDGVATTAATIEKVTIVGLDAASTIGNTTETADALKEVTLKNSVAGGKVTIESKVETLNLNLDEVVATTEVDFGTLSKLKTLNVDASGKDSSVELTNITVETLNISGNAAFTLESASTLDTAASLKNIVVTNTKGVVIEDALNNTTKFTGGAGADSIEIGATTQAITMGAGDDKVIYTAALGTGGSVDAGADKDTVSISAALISTDIAADATNKFNNTFKNFEVLEVTGGGNNILVDVEKINNVSTVVVSGAALTGTSSINNLVSGGTVTLQANTNALAVNVKNAAFSNTDVLNLEVANGATISAGTVTAAGVETINIKSTDTDTTAADASHTITLTAADATTVNVTGNTQITVTATGSTKVATFDASAATGNVLFTSTNVTIGENVTIKGGAGNDTLSGTANANDTIIGGAGNDILIYTGGSDKLNGGTGTDTFTIDGKGTKASHVTIEDLLASDKIDVTSVGTQSITSLATKITAGSGATFDQLLDAAAADTTAADAGSAIATWFQFENNTYLVVDNSTAASFVDGADVVIKINGLVDLAYSAADVITIA